MKNLAHKRRREYYIHMYTDRAHKKKKQIINIAVVCACCPRGLFEII